MSSQERAVSLKNQMEADLDTLFNTDEFAELVTYRVNETGATSSIKAIGEVTADLAQTPQGRGITGTWMVKGSDVPRPEIYDTITQANGRVWRVESCVGGDGVTWTLFCTSDNRAVA